VLFDSRIQDSEARLSIQLLLSLKKLVKAFFSFLLKYPLFSLLQIGIRLNKSGMSFLLGQTFIKLTCLFFMSSFFNLVMHNMDKKFIRVVYLLSVVCG